MIWTVLNVVLAILLAGVVSIVLLSGLATGLVCLHLGRRDGPRTLLVCTVLGPMLTMALWVWAGRALDLEVAGYTAAFFASSLALLEPCLGWKEIPSEVERDTMLAAWLPGFGLRVFDDLDADKDGIVTRPDLTKAMTATLSDSEARFYLYLLRENLDDIGHSLDSAARKRLRKQEKRKWFANSEDLQCGIDRNDLATYAARVHDRHKNWL